MSECAGKGCTHPGCQGREEPTADGLRARVRALRAEVEAIHAGRRDPARYVPNRADRRAAKRGKR